MRGRITSYPMREGSMGRRVLIATLLLAGCSEYKLSDQEDLVLPIDTGTTEPDETTPETTEPDVPVDTAPPEPTCADVDFGGWSWVGSPVFTDAADPVDGVGTPFWDPSADTSGWDPVVLPDRGIPIEHDRAYVALFDLPEVPVNLSLNLQSDDGIVVWVNGVYVGQWGGDWQLEGCVNENAQCLVTIQVDPVDVTELLHVGTNRVAARVSNPVQNAYFEIIPECVEP
jgi:hypothetical protein